MLLYLLPIFILTPTIKKTLHQAINVTTTETELFAIRCGISQAIQVSNISYIIVIINSIHTAQNKFDSTIYPFQLQLITISKNLRLFFNKYSDNFIEVWNCPSNEKWPLYTSVDKDTKQFNLTSLYLCKML